jgi:hypothetical protein
MVYPFEPSSVTSILSSLFTTEAQRTATAEAVKKCHRNAKWTGEKWFFLFIASLCASVSLW